MRNTSTRLLLPATTFFILFVSFGCSQTQGVYDYFKGNTPGKYARMMEDTTDAENRRVGISKLVAQDFARKDPYTTRYRQIFQTDENAIVRATAIRALNVSRDSGAGDLYLKALVDPDVLVRLEGAKALVNMPNPDATDALLKVLNATEEDQDVRIAAAKALQHYQRRDVARTLVGFLNERAFGLSWQARNSLKQITGVDYAYNDSAWLEFINDPSKPLT